MPNELVTSHYSSSFSYLPYKERNSKEDDLKMSSSIINIFQIIFLTLFFPFHITSESVKCEPRFSMLEYIWKFISTYRRYHFYLFLNKR